MTEHGPGLSWLGRRTGQTPEELLADPRRLTAALVEAGRAATEIAAGLHSDDPTRRAEAEREAALLRSQLAAAPDPADRFRSRVAGALRDAAARVENAPRPGQGSPD